MLEDILPVDESGPATASHLTAAEISEQARALESYLRDTGWTIAGLTFTLESSARENDLTVCVTRGIEGMRKTCFPWFTGSMGPRRTPFFDFQTFFDRCLARVREAIGKEDNVATDPVTGRSVLVAGTE